MVENLGLKRFKHPCPYKKKPNHYSEGWAKVHIGFSEGEREVRNLSLEKSCSVEKQVVEVISDGGMNLQKDILGKSDSKEESNGSKVMMEYRTKSCGRNKSELHKKQSIGQRQYAGLEKGKRNKKKQDLWNLVEVPEEMRKRIANKEDKEEQLEKKYEEKSSDEPLVNTWPNDTQTRLISVNVDIDDSQKEKTGEKKDEEASLNEKNVETQPPPVKDTTEEEKTEEDKTKKEKTEKEKLVTDAEDQLKTFEDAVYISDEKD
ncbi:uncharacterized protein LOC131858575 [Cryptomeria japonica]|uniref:uncharacterized protein LOC131858575 n=1 Tax=Cryptomeria japonica TaxID=3369 RepID=UPI0027DA8251|nr:uncharacterized protein LOC131858575 [Cryptomeria japonica]